MSTDKSAQPIKDLTECSTESDKTQSTASHVTSSEGATTTVLEERDDKKDDSNMKLDTSTSESESPAGSSSSRMSIPESASDFNQWLQSMLAVARLPGGMPIEFRRKLWLALAERYLKRRNVDWEVEKVKWLTEKSRADDEELGIQIVKDLHRTGHSMLSGASGQLYQAKLKKILMGYTRWNPEVGYCQGFNMLGAIILQVMDKSEVDSIKVMIFLIEGLLPNGYFSGGLLGLQADMAVFRELLGYKLPKLAKHLHKLQNSTNEPSFEPPIINVFTMQWFLTLFCNCLPMSYVLRIWDLIMIEGSDILLRTALSIWKLLEDRILREVRTADDFYCKMGTLSAELLNGTLIDANRLIHMISTLGPISELQQLRQKHLTASYNDQKQLKMLYSSAETDESRMAVANAWASRRGSQPRLQSDREKIALDITILKKQYDKLRERQKQAHIILSSAVSKQNQHGSAGPSAVNKLLVGKNAIISKGRKGPPKGSIPPVRNQKLTKSSKAPAKLIKPDETLQWKNTEEAKKRRNSLTWKELNAERRTEEIKTMSKSSSASSLGSCSKTDLASPKRRSDSSSYSEDSDGESSTSTSLCDDDITSSLEASPMKKKRHKDLPTDASKKSLNMKTIEETSPIADDKQCPEISISVTEVDSKGLSPIANFYLDLNTNLECGDITSISQLSPMPDFSSYFTAISPIQTPCNFFEFPNFSSFIMDTDEKFQVTEDGVTNEFFERVYEESSSLNALSTTPDNSKIMSKSFSPSILKNYDREEEMTAEECGSESKSVSKYIKQKSLSMDEQSLDKEEVIAINRSFSDGTIINVDNKNDGYQKIIAENLKILNKLTMLRTTPDSLTETHFTKLNIESVIIEEPKSPNNLSDVEEEIAAIDNVEEADEAKEEIFHSDIQDLASIETYLDKREYDAALACNTYTKEENVTERNEKSICDESREALATLACIPLENKSDAEREACEIKAPAEQEEISPKVEVRKAEEKSVSPKFNEIQLMVDKLKEEMENQLKGTDAEVQSEIQQAESGRCDVEVKCDTVVKVQVPKIVVHENSFEKADESTLKLSRESSRVNDEVKPSSQDASEKTIDASCKKATSSNGDLEKVASQSVQKIDKSDSDMVLEKLNTQLEKCQNPKSEENLNLDRESSSSNKMSQDNNKVDCNEKMKMDSVNAKVKKEPDMKTSRDASTQICSRSVSVETPPPDFPRTEPKKESRSVSTGMTHESPNIEVKTDTRTVSTGMTHEAPKTVVKMVARTMSTEVIHEAPKAEAKVDTRSVSTGMTHGDAKPEAKIETRTVSTGMTCEVSKSESRADTRSTSTEMTHDIQKAETRVDSRSVSTDMPSEVAKKESKNVSTEMANEAPKVEAKKDSNEILEKLNIQLQRFEPSSSKGIERKAEEPIISYVSSKDKSTYETSAIMELSTLIKERELEKLSEQKLLMKSGKDFDFDLNVSPIRTPRSKSNVSSPEASNGKFNNFFYDHEPRNDVRRRDIATLETEQRMRRQFKSSPTSSLSASPSNISNTLSSIQNTIKILDSACQKTDLVNIKTYDRAMENVEKMCDTDRDWKYYKKSHLKYDPSPSFKIDDVSFDSHQSKRRPLIDDDKVADTNYDLSPRRKRYDMDADEPLYKSSRDVSPRMSPSRFTAKTPEIDPEYVAKLRYLSTEDYIAGRKSPLGGSREMLDIKFKLDRSPTSPVLSSTRFTKPPLSPRSPRSPSHNPSLLRFPSNDNRSSKSAENSPSRYSGERVESNCKYNSAGGTIDSKADSMSNLASYKPIKKYDYEWETPSNKKKYDFY